MSGFYEGSPYSTSYSQGMLQVVGSATYNLSGATNGQLNDADSGALRWRAPDAGVQIYAVSFGGGAGSTVGQQLTFFDPARMPTPASAPDDGDTASTSNALRLEAGGQVIWLGVDADGLVLAGAASATGVGDAAITIYRMGPELT